MKKFFAFMVWLALLSACAPGGDGYKLVWEEDFNGDSLDHERWNIEVNGHGGGNHELQYYTDKAGNVTVKDGCLVLTARREGFLGKEFTSGRVNSRGKVRFQYGKIEARVKLPRTENGLWPAFWMMGDDITEVGWPRCGETDIFEFGHANGIAAGTQDRFFNGAMHWGERHKYEAMDTTWTASLQDGEFHVFTCVWTPERMEMYCDGSERPYFAMDIAGGDTLDVQNPVRYFHKPNFILFNLAVGGDFTVIHEGENITALNEGNGDAEPMLVDWVRIYQRGDEGESRDIVK